MSNISPISGNMIKPFNCPSCLILCKSLSHQFFSEGMPILVSEFIRACLETSEEGRVNAIVSAVKTDKSVPGWIFHDNIMSNPTIYMLTNAELCQQQTLLCLTLRIP